MSDCNHNCSSCSSDCETRETGPQSLQESLNESSRVNHVIAVISGKGGVGKSFVTSLMAAEFQRRGRQTAILDADLTGPSIPRAFHLHDRIQAVADENYKAGGYMVPARTQSGIQVVSLNLLLNKETDPVLWRGPVIAGTVTQFWTEVYWDNVDIMFVDMPPGTGDVALTVLQSIKVDGIIIVTSPQDLVSMIVAKAINMAKSMHVPVLGIVENMSYFLCPTCGEMHPVFGISKLEEIAADYSITNLLRLPLAPGIAPRIDAGLAESIILEGVSDFANRLNLSFWNPMDGSR